MRWKHLYWAERTLIQKATRNKNAKDNQPNKPFGYALHCRLPHDCSV